MKNSEYLRRMWAEFLQFIETKPKPAKPVKPLASSWGFWLSIALPVLCGVGARLFFLESPLGLDWCTTADCLDDWSQYNKFPLLIAGLAVPITAMYIAHHRSLLQDRIFRQQSFENNRLSYLALYKDFDEEYAKHMIRNDRILGAISSKALFQSIVAVDENFERTTTVKYLKYYEKSRQLETLLYLKNEGDEQSDDTLLHGFKVYILAAGRAGLIERDDGSTEHMVPTVLRHLTSVNKFLHDFLPFSLGIPCVAFDPEGLDEIFKEFFEDTDVLIQTRHEFVVTVFDIPRSYPE
jgi:hypothetical protein